MVGICNEPAVGKSPQQLFVLRISSLRSKRFRSSRHFRFLAARKVGRVLAPIFARSKSEKCFKPSESPTETLATQAGGLAECVLCRRQGEVSVLLSKL